MLKPAPARSAAMPAMAAAARLAQRTAHDQRVTVQPLLLSRLRGASSLAKSRGVGDLKVQAGNDCLGGEPMGSHNDRPLREFAEDVGGPRRGESDNSVGMNIS